LAARKGKYRNLSPPSKWNGAPVNKRSIKKRVLRIKIISTMAMKLYTLDELKDRDLGPVGTPERDKYEAQLAEELEIYL